MDSSKPAIVERLVKRVLKYDDSKLPDQLETTLNQILKTVFFMPSCLDLDILCDPNKFNKLAMALACLHMLLIITRVWRHNFPVLVMARVAAPLVCNLGTTSNSRQFLTLVF